MSQQEHKWGSEYTATAPQAGEVLKQGELEYVLEGRKADSAAEDRKSNCRYPRNHL